MKINKQVSSEDFGLISDLIDKHEKEKYQFIDKETFKKVSKYFRQNPQEFPADYVFNRSRDKDILYSGALAHHAKRIYNSAMERKEKEAKAKATPTPAVAVDSSMKDCAVIDNLDQYDSKDVLKALQKSRSISGMPPMVIPIPGIAIVGTSGNRHLNPERTLKKINEQDTTKWVKNPEGVVTRWGFKGKNPYAYTTREAYDSYYDPTFSPYHYEKDIEPLKKTGHGRYKYLDKETYNNIVNYYKNNPKEAEYRGEWKGGLSWDPQFAASALKEYNRSIGVDSSMKIKRDFAYDKAKRVSDINKLNTMLAKAEKKGDTISYVSQDGKVGLANDKEGLNEVRSQLNAGNSVLLTKHRSPVRQQAHDKRVNALKTVGKVAGGAAGTAALAGLGGYLYSTTHPGGLEALGKAADEGVAKFNTEVKDTATGLYNDAKAGAIEARDNVNQWWGENVEPRLTQAEQFVSNVPTTVTNWYDTAKQGVTNFANETSLAAKDAWNTFANTTSDAVKQIPVQLNKAWDTTNSWLAARARAAAQPVINTANTVGDVIGTGLTNVGQAAQNLGNDIVENMTELNTQVPEYYDHSARNARRATGTSFDASVILNKDYTDSFDDLI